MSSRAQQRKEKRQKSASGGVKRLYLILGGVGLIGVVAAVYTTGSTVFSNAVTEPVDLGDLSDEELVNLAHGSELGDPDAPISVVEFGDYQCPGCAMFASGVKPLIELNLVNTGRAKFVFYDLPLAQHSNSFLASRASHCAGDQDRFWDYHTTLFENQFSWASSGDPVGNFVGYARALGMDEGAFRDCLNSDRHARRVSANLRLASALSLTSTPSVLVSRGSGAARRLPGNDYVTIEDAVEQLTEGEP
ncbi:MAG: thioredoxin domain-containing protein [Gammaproteobacteria bacterium]|nr:thioredoxin domain-containing protein [Gammaproteobacteria bacterium]